MRNKTFQIILILVALCQTALFAQTSRVTGKMTGPDNKPVAGASVTISGTTNNSDFSLTHYFKLVVVL